MSKICVIGHFGYGKKLLNGQTIKTKIITEELENEFKNENIKTIDTAGRIKKIPYMLFRIPIELAKCDDVIMMPSQNGLLFFTPLLTFWNKIFKKNIHYVVIGGWLAKYLSNKKWLMKNLYDYHGIYVETEVMKQALEKMGFNNIFILPNCKKLKVLEKSELVYPKDPPFKICIFSRITKRKGIGSAVKVIKEVNKKLGYNAYFLDIYGQVSTNDQNWFKDLQDTFPDYISYKGYVDADKSVEVLKNYFALLFPTHIYTEGLPGTIIDAYAAGIPVISSKWESFDDVIDEGKTGLGYEFDNLDALEELLLEVAKNPKILLDMKLNCLKKSKLYTPSTAIKVLTERINN